MRQKPVGEPAATAAWNFGRPRCRSSLKRLGPFCHCRQRYARSLRRIHASRWVSTRGVWQKPKYPRHPRRYGARSSITCGRLFPRVRRVMSRICALNLASAFGAMRRSLPSFAMLNPRNLRFSAWNFYRLARAREAVKIMRSVAAFPSEPPPAENCAHLANYLAHHPSARSNRPSRSPHCRRTGRWGSGSA